MKNSAVQITPDNIQTINQYLKKQRRINKRRNLANTFAQPISILLFFALGCLLTFMLACKFDPSLIDYPIVGDILKLYNSYIPILDMKWYFMVLTAILTLYVPPFVIYFVIHVIFWIFVRPSTGLQELPSDQKEQAKILAANHKKAISSYNIFSSDEGTASIVCSVIFAVLTALFPIVLACIRAEIWYDPLADLLIPMAITGFVLWFVCLAYFVYILQSPIDHIKDKYGSVIDAYWLENDEEEAKRRADIKAKSDAIKQRQYEEYRSSLVHNYIQQKKEHEDYKKRLHEWATDGDDPTPGAGDGI